MVIGLFGWNSFTLGHHFANFGSNEMFYICHMISKDHVFKGLCDIMGGSPSLHAKFIGQGPVVVAI